MTIAVVVVCPSEMIDAAAGWGAAGLVADSFWLCSDNAGQIDQDHPNSLAAVRIIRGQKCDPAPLALSLHQLGKLDEVRVAWVRPPEDSYSESLKSLEQLLRELLPPDRIHWLDIVVPTRRTDRTTVPLPGQWVQLRVLPEDRSAPDVTDAGWDLGLDVALHAVLIAAGILGGTFHELPWAAMEATDRYEYRAFSRLLLGAKNTDHESRRFVEQTIPVSSAGSFFPHRYLELDDEASMTMVDNALRYIFDMESGALRYKDPEPSQFIPPPRLKVGQHLMAIWRFLGHCFRVILGIRPAPVTAAGSKFDFKDLGYNVGESATPVPVDWTTKPADFDVLDQQAAEEARRILEQCERDLHRENPIAPARTWRTLVRLATSLNDGGPRPDGWDPPDIHERKPVLAAHWVQPTPATPVSSNVPELKTARNAVIAASAANDARRRRHTSLAAPRDVTGVVATAQNLANEGNALDEQRLAEQLSGLDAAAVTGPVSFLDRLSGQLIGAGLRARLDTERWSEFATAPTQLEASNWDVVERKFRRRALIGLAAGAGISAIWGVVAYFLRGLLPGWLSMPVGFTLIAAILTLYVLWIVYVFFKNYSAYMERGRRRLELRRIWLNRACRAMRESVRLREPRRIHTLWIDLLASIFPHDNTRVEPPERSMPARPPYGTSIAVPVYTAKEMTKWLADEGAEVGWRYRALREIASSVLAIPPDDAIKQMVEDTGLKGGPLQEVWSQRNRQWDAYADLLRCGVAGDIAGRMVDSHDRAVTLLVPGAGQQSGATVVSFSREPWPDTRDDEGDLWPTQYDHSVHVGRGNGPSGAHPNEDLCQMSVRIQLRQLETRDDRGDDQLTDDDDDIY